MVDKAAVAAESLTSLGVCSRSAPRRGFASRQAIFSLLILTLAYTCVGLDRAIISVVLQPIKHEFGLTDSQLGMLPLAFSLFFVVVGVPLGLLADRFNRHRIITASLVAFSLATALCGIAQNFAQLLLARIGVGAGEAGSGPAAMSMISDLFPQRERASALALYYLATPLGIILTFAVGGYLVGQFGWRATFLAAGAPGLGLALVLVLFMREPGREREPESAVIAKPSTIAHLRTVIGRVRRQPALRHLVVGTTLNAMVSAAILIWCAPFLLRAHGMPVAQAGLMVSLYYGAVSTIGVLGGGLIADRLSRLGQVWRTRLLAMAALLSIPGLLGLLLYRDVYWMFGAFASWAVLSSIWYGPAYGLMQSLVEPRQRATLSSLLYLLSNLIGVGLGPQLVGIFSDALAPRYGEQALGYGMAIMALGHLWAMWHFQRAGHTIERELALNGQ